MSPQPDTSGIFRKSRSLDTDVCTRRTLCEDKGREREDASTKQGTPKIASEPLEARGEAWKIDSPSWPSEETNLANNVTSSLQNQKTMHFCCVSTPAVELCYDTPRQLTRGNLKASYPEKCVVGKREIQFTFSRIWGWFTR